MSTILVGQARKRSYSSDAQAPKKEHPVKEVIMQAKVEEKKAPAPKEEEVPVTTAGQEVKETQETAQEAPQEKKEKTVKAQKPKKGKTQKK